MRSIYCLIFNLSYLSCAPEGTSDRLSGVLVHKIEDICESSLASSCSPRDGDIYPSITTVLCARSLMVRTDITGPSRVHVDSGILVRFPIHLWVAFGSSSHHGQYRTCRVMRQSSNTERPDNTYPLRATKIVKQRNMSM